MPYARRLLDDELDAVFGDLAAIAIDGPKGVGKTATALRRSAAALRLDEPDALALVLADPDRALSRSKPLLVDEWQRAPQLWDRVRRAVDDGAPPSSFLLTGSATPPSGSTTHSGTGRILSLRMRPMSLAERGLIAPTVSMQHLLDGDRSVVEGDCSLRVADYAREIEASGFPGIRDLSQRTRRAQLDSYLVRAMSRDLEDERGVTIRRPESLRSWLAAYAAASSTTASWEAIRRAATPGDADPPTKLTTIRYRDWLTALWLLDPVPAWRPIGTSITRLAASAKHQLADPALAARLLQLSAASLLDGEGRLLPGSAGPVLGALFESLATLSVRTCAQVAEAQTFHLRTERGEHEVDLIAERHDGRVVGFEVKLAPEPDERAATHLRWLREAHGSKVSDLVVLTTGQHAYRRRDGIAVVPLALLGP